MPIRYCRNCKATLPASRYFTCLTCKSSLPKEDEDVLYHGQTLLDDAGPDLEELYGDGTEFDMEEPIGE